MHCGAVFCCFVPGKVADYGIEGKGRVGGGGRGRGREQEGERGGVWTMELNSPFMHSSTNTVEWRRCVSESSPEPREGQASQYWEVSLFSWKPMFIMLPSGLAS